MNTTTTNNWYEANQEYLMAAVGVVREYLNSYKSSLSNNSKKDSTGQVEISNANKKLKQAAENLPYPAALNVITDLFNLSPFEQSVLLMCAGIELDSNFAKLCASIKDDLRDPYPTFSMALSALPDAHWSALSPNTPLRYWHLIEIGDGNLLTNSSLHIDERVLHYLTGVSSIDERLSGFVEPQVLEVDLVPSHQKLVEHIIRVWSKPNNNSVIPVIQLSGEGADDKRAIAAAACTQLNLNLYIIPAYMIPGISKDLTELIRLWEREASLDRGVLLLDCSGVDTTDVARINILTHFCERMRGTIIISSNKKMLQIRRLIISIEVSKPTAEEQYEVWMNSLSKKTDKLNDHLDKVVSQFNLGTTTIKSVSADVLRQLETDGIERQKTNNNLGNRLWEACCVNTRPEVDQLAQRIEPIATWDDIVLPVMQKQILKEIAIHVKQRKKVYREWGFAEKSSRGLGITALFTGESGTGKTMASEVLANELHLDLYKIDLSQVVNKYIGETEKNLKKIFDAAEEGGAILLFDEADALFGKRSEVKDSHDRYSNIEVSYLLQRMEAYRGLAILTTNMKSALDKAFIRRIRFIVQFPFPDAAQRAEIWRHIFPSNTPTKDLDFDKLARLNIVGGSIRNIALNSAFLAAENGRPVCMADISQSARTEYAKLEKPISSIEIGEW